MCDEEESLDQEVEQALEWAALAELPFHWDDLLESAVYNLRLDLCERILTQDVDPSPALHALACQQGDLEARLAILNLFHQHGASVTREHRPHNETSVHYAALNGQLEILRYLVEHMDGSHAFTLFDAIDHTPLHNAIIAGDLECAEYLLEQGHNPNHTSQMFHNNRIGYTALSTAINYTNYEMVQLLMKWGGRSRSARLDGGCGPNASRSHAI